MLRVELAAQQIPYEPAQLVVKLSLIGEKRGAESFAEIFGLDQFRARVDGSNRAHRQHNSPALPEQGGDESLGVTTVRIPQAVPAAEARRGKGLVDGRVMLDPGIPMGDRSSV